MHGYADYIWFCCAIELNLNVNIKNQNDSVK